MKIQAGIFVIQFYLYDTDDATLYLCIFRAFLKFL